MKLIEINGRVFVELLIAFFLGGILGYFIGKGWVFSPASSNEIVSPVPSVSTYPGTSAAPRHTPTVSSKPSSGITPKPSVSIAPTNLPLGTQVSVKISDSAFSPSNIAIRRGMSIVFTNTGFTPHWIIGDSDCPDINSLHTLQHSEVYEFNSTKPETCTITDKNYPNIKASVIIVQQ